MGEQEAQVDEVVVRPPEPEGGAVEQPGRCGESQRDRRFDGDAALLCEH